MKKVYTPSLEVSPSSLITKIRELPLLGKSHVKVGDSVKASDVVLSADLPGELFVVRVADRLGVNPEDVKGGIKVGIGQRVERGDLLCEVKSFFGFFSSRCFCPIEGEIEFFTEANGHVGIREASRPIAVSAYVDGRIKKVDEGKSVEIETTGAVIQGIFGVGGETSGEVLVLEQRETEITKKDLDEKEVSEKVLVGGRSFSLEALALCAEKKVRAVVTGSIDSATLQAFVGFEIGVSITGDEEVPFTLIITEGFGSLALSERVVELARKLEGHRASVNGATQVRAGAMRPELIVTTANLGHGAVKEHSLEVGSQIRIIRVPYFGELAEIIELPHEQQLIPTGAKVRVLKAKLPSGEEITVPRANIELL